MNAITAAPPAGAPAWSASGAPAGAFLRIDQIRVNGGTQARAGIDAATVAEYESALSDGADFPPLVVCYDGADYWLADGFHRLAAYRTIGERGGEWNARAYQVPVEIRAGTRRDAILYACGANATHGLRRTNADKRRAVETLLRDEEWRQWSDREIGRRAGVDGKTVGQIRKELAATAEFPQSAERRGADGRTIDTAPIGARAGAPLADPDDDRAAFADAQRRFAALGWRLERHGLHYKLRDADAELYATGALALHLQTLERLEAMEARARATESPPSRAPTDDGAARRAHGALMRATDATLDADARERAHRAALLDAEAIGDAPLRIAVLEEVTRACPAPAAPPPDPHAPPAARAARFVADQRAALARYDALVGVSQREHRQALSHIDALLDVIANGARGALTELERAIEATADALDDERYEALSRAAGALTRALAVESGVTE